MPTGHRVKITASNIPATHAAFLIDADLALKPELTDFFHYNSEGRKKSVGTALGIR
jgi:hypothetical protein